MKNNFKNFFGKLLAVTICATLVAGATPVAGVFADEVSSDAIVAEEVPATIEEPVVEEPVVEEPVVEEPVVQEPVVQEPVVQEPVVQESVTEPIVEETMPVESVEIPVEETPIVDEPVSENIVSENTVSEDIVSANTVSEEAVEATVEHFCEPITEWADLMEVNNTNGESSIMATGTQYYYQPSWYPNTAKGYDAIVAYITNDKGEYAARCFFVTDGSEWLLYDYGETAATEFFTQTELKDGKYIPVQQGKSRSDNAKTVGIDESKIPTITDTQFYQMVYDWRVLQNVPFSRDDAGNLIYAGTKSEDPDNPNPAPTPDGSLISYSFTVNSNSYQVRVTKEVGYNGRRHVAKWAKNTAKQCPDLDIQLYRNNELVEHSYYKITYYNNLNVNGYSKENKVPCFTITLKNEYPFKSDRATIAKKGFGFSIIPADISTANFKVKKVRVTTTKDGVKVSLNTPSAKIADKTIKLTPVSTKNPRTGSYTASYVGGNVVIYGANNFTGSTTLNLSAAKSMDYVF